MKLFVPAIAAVTILTGAASAQTTAPRTTPAQPAPSAPAQTVQMKQMLSSDIVNSSVYDPGENKIGTIDNIMLAPGGEPEQAIIGVGGFLGVGEKDVAIPFADLKVKERDGKKWFELARTKDELKAAPTFDSKAHKM